MSSLINFLDRVRRSGRVGVSAAIFLAVAVALPHTAAAGGVVTNLTSQALVNAMNGGGTVTFGQNGTITLSNQITVRQNTVLDGTGRNVTIQGVGGTNGSRLFNVRTGVTFTVIGLTLQNGHATNGGAIYSRGTLLVTNCNFRNNSAVGRNGANGANRPDSDDVPADGGTGAAGGTSRGGAVFTAGRATFVDCVFDGNTATGGNGGNGGKGGNAVGGAFEGGDSGTGGNGGGGQGGAIYNSRTLTVRDCSFTGNGVTGGNAGEAGEPGTGPIVGIKRSGGNGGVGAGGAIFTSRRGTIISSTFANNTGAGGDSGDGGVQDNGDGADGSDGADATGGAICNTGTNGIIKCTFVRNRVSGGNGGIGGNGGFEGGDGGDGGDGIGGAIYNSGARMGVTNCTIATGSAAAGAGGTNGTALVPGSPGNTGSRLGGNIANVSGRLVLINTILDDAGAGGNAHGNIVDGGANISSDNSIALPAFDSRANLNPRLDPLQENGGPTETMALRPNSPAIDAGRPTICELPELTTDQRGFPRFGDSCDIGAFEFEVSSIRGRVTDASGNGVGEVTITANDLAPTTTDSDGFYAFLGLGAGNYVVTPSRSGYNFTPSSYAFVLGPDTNNIDFLATTLPVINGSITFNGSPLSNVMVTAGSVTTFTDGNGDFLLTDIPTNTTVVIRPQLNGYEFVPPSVTLTVISNMTLPEFTAATTVSLSGRVLDNQSLPVPNVPVTVGTLQGITDTNGFYQVSGLSRGATYEVRPALNGYQFLPSSRTVTVGDTTTNMDFTAIGLFSIGGRVLLDGVGTSGIQVVATNAASTRTTTTDSNGNYQFSELGPSTYTIRVSHQGYQFSPVSRLFVLTGNITAADFDGTRVLTISGTVINGDNPPAGLAGVSVIATNQAGARSTVTASNGVFTITNVASGTTTVRASLGGYEFAPSNIVFLLNSNGPALTITGYQIFTISGSVTNGTHRLTGVSIQAGAYSATSSNGNYTLTGVRNGSYNVTPQLEGYTFNPASAPVTVGPSTIVNFQAIGVYTISGRISDTNGGPRQGVEVFAGGQRASTGPDGSYVITGLGPGTYTVRPVLATYAFEPFDLNITVGPNNQTDVNFIARPAFSVSGRVTAGGTPVSGVRIDVGGRTATTDFSGGYIVLDVPTGEHDVIPSLAGAEFDPDLRRVNITNNVLGVDFRRIFRLSGFVREGDAGVEGVTVLISTNVSNPVVVGSAMTDSLGAYQTGPLNPGTYLLSAQLEGRSFLPNPRIVTVGPSTNNIDFFAGYRVGGRITKGGSGLPNVSVALDSRTTTTDLNGFYMFTNVVSSNYTVVPTLAGNGFAPSSVNVTVGPDNTNVHFTAFTVFNVSGQITGQSGPLAGVTVSASGVTALTSNDGRYTIVGLASGTHSVVPALSCYTFSPPNRLVTVGPGANNVDFGATFQSFTVSGHVRNVTNFPGVLITLGNQTTLTDSNGFYSFTNACAGTNLFFASFPGYYFDTNYNELEITGDTANLDFIPFRRIVVSGRIMDAISNGIGGIEIDSGTQTTTSNPDGGYFFALDPRTEPYTFTPRPLNRFTPTNWMVNVVSNDISGLDFIINPLEVLSITSGTNGMDLAFLGFPSRNYTIQVSTNLANPNDWLFLFNTNAPVFSNGFFIYTDSSATNVPTRFYRAVSF